MSKLSLRDMLGNHISEGTHFALISRRQREGGRALEYLQGKFCELASLSEIADIRNSRAAPGSSCRSLTLIPFRQIAERGFEVVNDATPLLNMIVARTTLHHESELDFVRSPAKAKVSSADFDIDDDAYAEIAQEIIHREIGYGSGSNFVLKRNLCGTVENFNLDRALEFYSNILNTERSAYWTFLVWTGAEFLIGATPERHVTSRGGEISMMPISGTLRLDQQSSISHLMSFLNDQKEVEELQMVVDEEMKMMCRLCPDGAVVTGPELVHLSSVIHTAYHISGLSSASIADTLTHTMFSPAIVGSPVQNACRVVARYEPKGRGYYAGVLALTEIDDEGELTLDSAIIIRTAYVAPDGRFTIPVGATIVRDSCPESEASETRAKASALLTAFQGNSSSSRASNIIDTTSDQVSEALQFRNEGLNKSWLRSRSETKRPISGSSPHKMLIIDGEDDFTQMLRMQFERSGLDVHLASAQVDLPFDNFDSVLLGPGPGDPTDVSDRRISSLYDLAGQLLTSETPFVAMCLGHQIVSRRLNLPIRRLTPPNQGIQKYIDYFGRDILVGFYNTFAAFACEQPLEGIHFKQSIEISRDINTGEIYGLRGKSFQTAQFHPESIISRDGSLVIEEMARFLKDACKPLNRRSVGLAGR
ncbi:hypothetical protein NS226_08345 [Aureimonas ureilytica]|uniref:anthranilate synthase n=2 Tax=Aureimonas ureilytica TaxID=401562 RepID=A0A175R9Y0_9HYPH|nr:hypothetical protein NS226_08345 [Aureimonas ureilytica]